MIRLIPITLIFLAISSSTAADELHAKGESRFADIQQLTFGGENAEAYWSPDGTSLIFQASGGEAGFACDQIFTVPIDGSTSPQLVSTGKGRTTCAYFSYPSADRIVYASTHKKGGPECPPNPDRSQGYVWPIFPSYEIYSALPDGSDVVALTDNKSYDAEATICPIDGSIIFTSDRDADLELYRMDADGLNVKRLTRSPGYDGGAFFSADCSQIVWRASRPREGEELDDFRALLSSHLVRPSKLEIFVANADGTDARQVTYLDSASFAPFLFPAGDRIVFSSNYGAPRGREFDIWAIDTDGTDLERITFSPDFDGFPMFSPDGSMIAFASNRNQTERGETNVFVARWIDNAEIEQLKPSPADRAAGDVAWLADDDREGRGLGTEGLDKARDWLVERFVALGVEPGYGDDGYLQPFEAVYEVNIGQGTSVAIGDSTLDSETYRPTPFSAEAQAEAEVVSAGYGIVDAELDRNDYDGVDVAGKIALVRRFVPSVEPFEGDVELSRRLGDIRYKAFIARQQGAVGMIVVDLPEGEDPPEESPLPEMTVEMESDAGLPVVVLAREVGTPLFEGDHTVRIEVDLESRKAPVANVVGIIRAKSPDRRPGVVVVGAHYDHLGFGGRSSLAPDSNEPHNGADDNASGTAALLEAARLLIERSEELERDVWLVAFSAEEYGVLGSSEFVRIKPPALNEESMIAMINMDMVGRLRTNTFSILGGDSAAEWVDLVPSACDEARVICKLGGDGYGPSDQMPFYAAGVPVLHLFTGVHDEYHKPSDDSSLINAVGVAKAGETAAGIAHRVAAYDGALTYKTAPPPPPKGDVRSYGASLGTIPDYAAAESGVKGVLLSGVRAGSPAETAGIQKGDLLVRLGGVEIGDIYDFVYVLRQAKPGQKATAAVERDGEIIELVVTYAEARRRM